MSPGIVTALLFLCVIVLMATGLPLAFTFGAVGMGFAIFLWGSKSIYIVTAPLFATATSFILLAVPGYIFMAMMLERSGIGDDLYKMMYGVFGPLRGGLAIGTVAICAIFAAMSGISATATITMGTIALPSMLDRKYDKSIALGCISAGGALGVLIPPSNLMIIYGALMEVSVGQLFMAGILPGLLLTVLMMAYIGVRCFFQPRVGPPLPPDQRLSWREKVASFRSVILPLILILVVLGSIYFGIATPTESAMAGSLGSVLCCAVSRKLNWSMFKEASYKSIRLTAMVMWIMFGAHIFVSVYTGLGAPQLMQALVGELEVNRWLILISMQLTFFVLGCFLDPIGILTICVPVFAPIAVSLGFDPVWFGILFVMNMEMAYMTPPFGFNLFYLHAVAPESVTMGDIYKSIWPFVVVQAICLALVMFFPQIVLFLPNTMTR